MAGSWAVGGSAAGAAQPVLETAGWVAARWMLMIVPAARTAVWPFQRAAG
ncbi:hypothetical protein HLB27_05505 [Dickeya dadantii]|nr:hypothetical protein [Dickeya dadantii]NPE70165.1 hypothetical protein [Dickeya dadantii]